MPTHQSTQREATASIRGYLYQFDASILAILSGNPEEKYTIEGVEDFDKLTEDDQTFHSQIKYYSSKGLTDAVIRDALLPTLEGFLKLEEEERRAKKYQIYGHFKEQPVGEIELDLDRLKGLLVRRSRQKDHHGNPILDADGKKAIVETNLQHELDASDDDLSDFCDRLHIQVAEAFDDHRQMVFEALRSEMNVTPAEAKDYLYPTALAKVSDLAIGRTRECRTISKRTFVQSINVSQTVYSAWAMREETENSYCKKIRDTHFSNLNIDASDRFFIIRLPLADTTSDFFDLITHVVSKWSSHKVKSKPNKERYAPFFFFPDIDAEELALLKTKLVAHGLVINDGYAFNGATFDSDHLVSGQTSTYPVAAKFVSNWEELSAALGVAKKKKVIVQVHIGEFEHLDTAAKQIAFQVSNAAMAKKIL